MNTLDFGAIREQESWFEDYDLHCPICEGVGDRDWRAWQCKCVDEDCRHEWTIRVYEDEGREAYEIGPDECPKCDGMDVEVEDIDSETECCESCTQGYFEVMWNTAYEVYLPHDADFKEMHLLAWDHGWCLITNGEHDHYLLSGGSGYDFSWKLHYIRWKIQDYLDVDDIAGFIRGGGHVFLEKEERDELLRYCRVRIPTPSDYVASYKSTVEHIDELLFPKKEEGVEGDEHNRPVHVD